ncbi:hypothetical protein BT69DRAFT_1278875 [Atractiella rhizophila]|nr:hypothetical protein BT69DRAFT_1278875 [Atractiella rhizophila]
MAEPSSSKRTRETEGTVEGERQMKRSPVELAQVQEDYSSLYEAWAVAADLSAVERVRYENKLTSGIKYKTYTSKVQETARSLQSSSERLAQDLHEARLAVVGAPNKANLKAELLTKETKWKEVLEKGTEMVAAAKFDEASKEDIQYQKHQRSVHITLSANKTKNRTFASAAEKAVHTHIEAVIMPILKNLQAELNQKTELIGTLETRLSRLEDENVELKRRDDRAIECLKNAATVINELRREAGRKINLLQEAYVMQNRRIGAVEGRFDTSSTETNLTPRQSDDVASPVKARLQQRSVVQAGSTQASQNPLTHHPSTPANGAQQLQPGQLSPSSSKPTDTNFVTYGKLQSQLDDLLRQMQGAMARNFLPIEINQEVQSYLEYEARLARRQARDQPQQAMDKLSVQKLGLTAVLDRTQRTDARITSLEQRTQKSESDIRDVQRSIDFLQLKVERIENVNKSGAALSPASSLDFQFVKGQVQNHAKLIGNFDGFNFSSGPTLLDRVKELERNLSTQSSKDIVRQITDLTTEVEALSEFKTKCSSDIDNLMTASAKGNAEEGATSGLISELEEKLVGKADEIIASVSKIEADQKTLVDKFTSEGDAVKSTFSDHDLKRERLEQQLEEQMTAIRSELKHLKTPNEGSDDGGKAGKMTGLKRRLTSLEKLVQGVEEKSASLLSAIETDIDSLKANYTSVLSDMTKLERRSHTPATSSPEVQVFKQKVAELGDRLRTLEEVLVQSEDRMNEEVKQALSLSDNLRPVVTGILHDVLTPENLLETIGPLPVKEYDSSGLVANERFTDLETRLSIVEAENTKTKEDYKSMLESHKLRLGSIEHDIRESVVPAMVEVKTAREEFLRCYSRIDGPLSAVDRILSGLPTVPVNPGMQQPFPQRSLMQPPPNPLTPTSRPMPITVSQPQRVPSGHPNGQIPAARAVGPSSQQQIQALRTLPLQQQPVYYTPIPYPSHPAA